MARYEKRQKERFEAADPAVLEALGHSVSVSVRMQAPPEWRWCTLNSGRPEKIVLAVKGGIEPVLTIPLASEELMLKNLAGAELAAFEGSASLPTAVIEQLLGKGLGFHLVFADRKPYTDTWKKDYAAKVLK